MLSDAGIALDKVTPLAPLKSKPESPGESHEIAEAHIALTAGELGEELPRVHGSAV